MYKFINPGSAASTASASNSAARTTLLATNRLGGSVAGLAKTVNNLEKIYKASAKNEKLVEIAERRRAKRDRDKEREEEIENQNLFNGKDLKKRAKETNSTKKAFGQGLKDDLLGGLEKILINVVGFLTRLFALREIKKLQNWFGDEQERAKRKEFVENLKYVFGTFIKFGKRLLIDNIAKPFDKMINGKNFIEKLQGLGKLIMGLAGLTVLLNPFGTMDAILSMLGMDFYRDRSQEGKGKGDGKGKTKIDKGKIKNTNKLKAKNVLKSKNGNRLYNKYRSEGFTHKQALNKTLRAARQKPNLFKPPKTPTSGLSPSGAPKGKIFSKGLSKGFGRGALKFLGKNNVKLLGKAFNQTFGRIPIFGTILTAVFSRLQGDPWGATIFKTAGAGVGGALGSFLLPGIGSWLGVMVGEYVGNLLYLGFQGGEGGTQNWKAAGKKLKEDAAAFIGQVKNIFNWMKERVTRFYKGIPKIKIPDFPKDPPDWIPKWLVGRKTIYNSAKLAIKAMLGPMGLLMGKEIPNVAWLMDGFGFKNTLPLLHKSFFKSDPVGEGKKTEGTPMNGVKGEEDAQAGDSTSGSGDTRGKPIKNKRGRIIGYTNEGVGSSGNDLDDLKELYDKKARRKALGLDTSGLDKKIDYAQKKIKLSGGDPNSVVYSDSGYFVPNKYYKGVETDNERYGDTFPEGSFSITKKKKSPYERKFGKKHNPLETVKDKGQFYETMPFIPDNKYKGVESDIQRYGNTVKDGSFGIGSKSTDVVSRHSTGHSSKQNKKPWWKFGFEQGGHIPQFLFGFVKKIFKGVTNVVKGVVNTVGSVVSKVASVAMPILSVAAPFIPALAPIMPFMQAANAVSAFASGDIMGGITGGLGALGGFFPKTFGAESAFGKFMSGNPLGKAIGGFMTGGISGALGSLTSFLPQGFQDFLGGIGGFMNKFPALGGIINGIPGLGGILGAFGVTGVEGAGFSPMSLFGDIANQMGFGSIFNIAQGLITGGGPNAVMEGLRSMAPELGVKPEALGIFTSRGKNARTNLLNSSQSEQSKAYAMQSQLEFIPMPVIIEKLTPISKAVPIGGQ